MPSEGIVRKLLLAEWTPYNDRIVFPGHYGLFQRLFLVFVAGQRPQQPTSCCGLVLGWIRQQLCKHSKPLLESRNFEKQSVDILSSLFVEEFSMIILQS